MIKGLPAKLKQLREDGGLSQRIVAERLNVSPSIISSYETGERTPSTENLLLLAYLFHCSTDFLLGKENDPQKSVINVEGLTKHQIRLLNELVDTMRQ